jgi:hypothetical protein
MSNYYNNTYFNSNIFDYDYAAIADAIIQQYQPERIIEFGCGNGDLSRALAAKGVYVEALDGYSTPSFSGIPNIRFTKVDLNNSNETQKFLNALTQKFDVALSFEVAEHLNPDISPALINWMTSMANVVIFSAAVPEQDGDGHINCRPREYWHHLLSDKGFMIGDNIRGKIRHNHKVARWYRHNIVDYYRPSTTLSNDDYKKLIERLVTSDSAASSDYYLAYRKMEYRDQVLNMQPVKFAFQLRNVLKKLMGKTVVEVK